MSSTRAFQPRLWHIVRSKVCTTPEMIDDACARAWMEFVRCQPDRDRPWRAWLVTTAEREAWRLHRAEVLHAELGIHGADDQAKGADGREGHTWKMNSAPMNVDPARVGRWPWLRFPGVQLPIVTARGAAGTMAC
jgi:DNA-directed RNA polymerase specialized sigma24 family protein